ncbi:hypothetical protein GcM3_133033 [Golovinomyces cichoracearum]|uniref:DDE-1 domain-containing protein n=1 Tax=Golovinomyces cichoracearum TaxID=62708 RepID=A0A420I3Y5_9PEZI|nr:hypothetical protein GcM3_133033 [Golovinomyces cichoracearum]
MVILSGQLMKEKYFKNGLHVGVLMAATESGYTNNWLSFKCLEHWEENSRPDDPEEWQLLIMDGHCSHLTYEFIGHCWKHKVLPFLLPPHSIYLLQPLDGVPF